MGGRLRVATQVGLVACLTMSGGWALVAEQPRVMWRLSSQGWGQPGSDAQSAYFLNRTGEVIAVDVRQGRAQWRAPLTMGAGDSDFPSGTRVAITNRAVVAGGYDLVGLDRSTGRRRWTFAPTGDYGFGFYLCTDQRDETVYTGSSTGGLHAVEASTGLPRWILTVGSRETTVYTPAIDEALVAAAFADFSATFTSGLVVVDRRSGLERWRRALPGSEKAPNVIAGGPVFARGWVVVSGYDGAIYAFERDTGRVAWVIAPERERTPDFRPLAVAADTLIAGSAFGELIAYDLPTQREQWRRRPGRDSIAFEITTDGQTVYVPYVSGTLVAVSFTDGRERWRVGGGRWGFRWPPHVAGGRMLVAGSAIGLVGYSLVDPPERETTS